MKFKNLRIAHRLSVGFGIVLVLLAIVSAVGILNLQHVNTTTTALANNNFVRTQLGNKALDSARGSIARVFQIAAMGSGDSAKPRDRLRSNTATFDEALAKLEQEMRTPQEKARLEKFKSLRDAYVASYGQVLALAAEGKSAEASELAYGDTYAAMHAFTNAVREDLDAQGKLFLTAMGEDNVRTFETARNQMLGLAAAALLAGVGFGFVITRSITRPIATAVLVAETVAAGDLTSRFDAGSTDEVGKLLTALQAMNDALLKVVTNVRGGTANIALASAEIAQGNADLSSRTEQQASALEETASSMEELTATVKQNAANAREARGMAASASEVAASGGKVVADVVETMASINQSSKKIVEIISVIDGIAFQTNILALNAAVEAARAGEQGRGFAVVASEVRNLAQRSAGAAKEIKHLIDSSVSQVEAGSRLVDRAGVTMTEVVASVQSVTTIMNDIAMASLEQEAGIEQINRAITEMDSVTQQNAALVEEAAAAASAMQDQATTLEGGGGVFKLDTSAERKSATAKPVPVRAPAAPRRFSPDRLALASGR